MLKKFILGRLVNLLLSKEAYNAIFTIVSNYANTSLSGEEKKRQAKLAIGSLKLKLSDSLVNLAIELAVAQIKLKG